MCAINDPLCIIGAAGGAAVNQAAGAAADSAVQRLADSVGEAVVRALATLATAWVDTPTPSAAELFTYNENSAGAGATIAQASPAVEFAQQLMLPITLGIMVIALTVAGIRMIVGGQRAGEEGRKILTGLVSMLVVSSLGLLGFTLLIQASDATASWILDNAIDNTSQGMADTFTIVFQALTTGTAGVPGAAALPAVMVIVGGIVLLLISFVQIILMILRGGLLVVMAGLLPTVAAAATTQTGMEWLQRYIKWAFALILYKPIAALIYAICFRMLVVGDEATGDDLLNVVIGLGLLFLACMALPALMRIIAPAAAAVAGNAGAIVAGAAAGAAAVGAMAVPMLAGGGALAAGGAGAMAPTSPGGGDDAPSPQGGGSADGSIGAPGSDGGPDQGGAPAWGTSGGGEGGSDPAGTSAWGAPSGGVTQGSDGTPGAPVGVGASQGSTGSSSPNLLGVSEVVSKTASTLESTAARTAEGATEEPRQD